MKTLVDTVSLFIDKRRIAYVFRLGAVFYGFRVMEEIGSWLLLLGGQTKARGQKWDPAKV